MNLSDHPHRRYNPLTGEWMLVSPHRAKRPWQGQIEDTPPDTRPQYDPTCYLCPGNTRANGVENPNYPDTYVFDNDFAALLPEDAGEAPHIHPLLQAETEQGTCRVLCFSPRHDLTLALMDRLAIRRVVDMWSDQTRELSTLPYINYVQIFENRGAMMGASNPHPHGQIWATKHLPEQVAREDERQRAYMSEHGRSLLMDYAAVELEQGERVVYENSSFLTVVPFWAVWPFETLLISKRHVGLISELEDRERDDLADALKDLTVRYDNVFRTSFPYSMGFHQRPVGEGNHWHLHAHFFPPLLRSATVRKFMVGFELLGMAQRDITAESAAARLREMPTTHYTVN